MAAGTDLRKAGKYAEALGAALTIMDQSVAGEIVTEWRASLHEMQRACKEEAGFNITMTYLADLREREQLKIEVALVEQAYREKRITEAQYQEWSDSTSRRPVPWLNDLRAEMAAPVPALDDGLDIPECLRRVAP